MDTTEFPQCKIRFENQLIECFPDVVEEREGNIDAAFVKQELDFGHADSGDLDQEGEF